MRKGTNIYAEAERLNNRIPALTMAQMQWICSQDQQTSKKLYEEQKRKVDNWCRYYAVISAYGDWQVNRYFIIRSTYGKDGYEIKYLMECSRRLIKVDKNGTPHLCVFEKDKAPFWYNKATSFSLDSPLKDKNTCASYRRTTCQFGLWDYRIYPRRSFTEGIRTKGWDVFMGREDELSLCAFGCERTYNLALDKDKVFPVMRYGYLPVKAETLMKTNKDFFRAYMEHSWLGDMLRRHWKSYLIARRHHYQPVENWSAWFDYVNDLAYCKMDTRNPKYLCPTDWEKARVDLAHARYRQCIKNEERAKELEKTREVRKVLAEEKKRAREGEDYATRIAPYLGLAFCNRELTIKVIPTAKDMIEEGREMHHCVGGYVTHADSLILSAKDKKGARVETIEVSLTTFKIVQSRGVCNSSTPQHDTICKLVKKNMNQIKAIALA